MKNEKKQKTQLEKSSFYVLLICLLISCQTKDTNSSISDVKETSDLKKHIDSSKNNLHNGDVVLRKGNDVISAMFAQMNKTDQRFSHCGITFYENGKWWVYHSIGGEDNPDAKLRRESFERFISKEHNHGFGICSYSLDSNQIQVLHDTVQAFHKREIPFDMKFDLESDDRFYCAEMVCKAYNRALKTDTFFNLTNQNGFVYISTDNVFTSKNAKLVYQMSYVD